MQEQGIPGIQGKVIIAPVMSILDFFFLLLYLHTSNYIKKKIRDGYVQFKKVQRVNFRQVTHYPSPILPNYELTIPTSPMTGQDEM